MSAEASEGAGEAGAWVEEGCGAGLEGQCLSALRMLRGPAGWVRGRAGSQGQRPGRRLGTERPDSRVQTGAVKKVFQQTSSEPGCVFCNGSIEVN